MFIERNSDKGWIEVICGSMFSGKTEELIRRIKRALFAQQRVAIFKPVIDRRYHDTEVVSHDRNRVESIPVENSGEIYDHSKGYDVIAIDEAQFFDLGLKEICVNLASNNKRVIVAGLDMDFRANPFGPMPEILAVAEYVTKVHAICMQCGDVASHTFKKVLNDQTVELGERELYEARCRACFEQGMGELKDQFIIDLD